MKIHKMEKDSAYKGSLPEGCRHCKEGSKLVLLVTGQCEEGCWYCPLSKKKKGKKVIYADEKKVHSEKDILNEARSINATGTGITGGDPLSTENTFDFIQLLKTEFGGDHHIHLYTRTTDIDMIRRAYDDGLDEIRFHPQIEDWKNIEETEYPLLLSEMKEDMDMDIGIEIPAIPEFKKETIHLLKELGGTVDFINLNEFEFSPTNSEELKKRGYEHKSDLSSAVKGSEKLARSLLNEDFKTSVHYCSLAFKDGVQLTNRIKRRAKTVSREGDIVTEEGTLLRGMIETEDGKRLAKELREIYDIPKEFLWYVKREDRIETSLGLLKEIQGDLEEDCFGIEVYPTADRLEVERWPLD